VGRICAAVPRRLTSATAFRDVTAGLICTTREPCAAAFRGSSAAG
jgi:hypothetical protein